jgi:hypothetical protein
MRFDIVWGLLSAGIVYVDKEWVITGKIREVTLISHPLSMDTQDDGIKTPDAPEATAADSDMRDIIPFIPVIRHFLSDLIHQIRIENITGEITYGTGDAALTGQIYGYYHAIHPLVTPTISVTLIPDFFNVLFRGWIHGGISIVYPCKLVIRTGRNALPVIVQMWRSDV